MADTNHEEKYIRLVRQANAHYVSTSLANLINSFILIYILKDRVPHPRLAGWFVLLAIIVAARAIYAYRVRIESYAEARQISRLYHLGLALTGMAWSVVVFALFPLDSLPHQTFISGSSLFQVGNRKLSLPPIR